MSRAPAASPGTPTVTVAFDIYGLRVTVGGDWPEVVQDALARLRLVQRETEPAGRAAVEIVVERRDPTRGRAGRVPASFVTPRNVVYSDDGRTVVDYFGRALSVLDRAPGGPIQGETRTSSTRPPTTSSFRGRRAP